MYSGGFRYRLALAAVVLFGAGVYYVVDQFDKGMNYIAVRARVVDVKETCHMEKRSGRRTSTSSALDCGRAREAVANDPEWQGYRVKYNIEVSYDYVSPVDARTHRGLQTLNEYPDRKTIKRGDFFDIRASKTDPNRSREIRSPHGLHEERAAPLRAGERRKDARLTTRLFHVERRDAFRRAILPKRYFLDPRLGLGQKLLAALLQRLAARIKRDGIVERDGAFFQFADNAFKLLHRLLERHGGNVVRGSGLGGHAVF